MQTTKHLTSYLTACIFALIAFSAQAATATRTSSFVYDPTSGLLKKEIIEPNNSNWCLVKEYTYDAFGNKSSTTTRNCNGSIGEATAPAIGSYAEIIPRTVSSTYTSATDKTGRFPLTNTNALGHTETMTYDGRFGGVVTLVGPNQLAPATWHYDAFGRRDLETRADATTTTWLYKMPCDLANGVLTMAKYCIASFNSGDVRYKRTYYDALNRKLAAASIDFTNTLWIHEGRIDYDALGRVDKTYLPYVRGSFATAQFATQNYDILNRVIRQTAPDGTISTTTYKGLTTTRIADFGVLNQTRIIVKNSQGQIIKATDNAGQAVSYLYDPFGNLTKTTDALGNETIMTYDKRGRKITMSDPDMGYWVYSYNALGELVRQKDAALHVTTMKYDKVGRMISRNEPDLKSTWEYDTATKGIGKLTTASSDNGYSRTHTYDSLGRPSSTSTVIDNTAAPYVTSVTYDSKGRIQTQTYPTGFAVKNIYNAANYLSKVVNAATPTTVYWTANDIDAEGHIKQQTYGNGVVTQQVYDPETGRLTNQYAGAGNVVQNMNYNYDNLGNLKIRGDVNNNLTETFFYDSLNRVTSASALSGAVNKVTKFNYDALGNITCKSDISACSNTAPNYSYNPSGAGSIRPHAVVAITGTVNNIVNPAFGYDSNGNMTSAYDNNGVGRTTTWTSFNMPNQITNQTASGIKTNAFWYSPEHERIKELQADQSIVIVLSPRYDTGLHFEKKYIADANGVLTGAVEYEHYLYADGMMFGQYATTTTTNGITIATTEFKYYSKDHLGSIVAITDGTGAVVERLSYDVWGKRRLSSGAADPNIKSDMYHGYTGHEMMEDVGLIHMNGRLYDPVMARFVSADPQIQAPFNLQSCNRYAYVWNNPLAAIDPSGYNAWVTVRGVVKVVVGAAAIVVGAAYGCAECGGAVAMPLFESASNDINEEDKPIHYQITYNSNSNAASSTQNYQTESNYPSVDTQSYLYEYKKFLYESSGNLVISYEEGDGEVFAHYGYCDDCSQDVSNSEKPLENVYFFESVFGPIRGVTTTMSVTRGVAAEGRTVLGHYPEYKSLAESLGARRFNIPESAWNKMSEAERWGANQKFLDRMISRGDEIILATPLDKVRPGSYFARELEYLSGKGYAPSVDGTRLIMQGGI